MLLYIGSLTKSDRSGGMYAFVMSVAVLGIHMQTSDTQLTKLRTARFIHARRVGPACI